MKFPLSWLKEVIAVEQDPKALASILTAIGLEVEGIYSTEEQDHIFEVGLTPNLSHAASIIGIARELAAVTGKVVTLPKISVKEEGGASLLLSVENPEKCPRYKARVLFDITVEESPAWLKKRLEMSGIRAINNVVDVTNYVMLELGHPLHAFDYDKIEGEQIIVRNAKPQERIVTLEEKEYFLTEEMLVIADKNTPLALAGVIGGTKAEVDSNTKKVVLEAAYFEPSCIRKTAKKLGIQTAASHHFERGTDPNILERALQRAATLLQKISSAKTSSAVIEKRAKDFLPKALSCRLARVNRILGTKLSLGEVETIFKRLGFEIVTIVNESIELRVPTYRNDLSCEIDLVEEVARLYGYDNIYRKNQVEQKTQDVMYQGSKIPHHPMYGFSKKVRFSLLAEGLQELLTCNLISPEEAALVTPAIFPRRSLIKILNPTSTAHSVLRPSLLPNILQVVKENAHHHIFSLAGFEVGRIHFKVKDTFHEPSVLAIVLTGKKAPLHWDKKNEEVDFFDLKGILENFFSAMRVEKVSFLPSQFDNFHPGRQAQLSIEKNHEIGIMGEVHPRLLQQVGLNQPLFFAELNLDDLATLVKKEIKMTPLPLFPSSTRDWTCGLGKRYVVGDLLAWIWDQPSKILEEVLVLDVYQSDKLGSGVKNVTLRFIYRDLEKTISFEEVEAEHERIIKNVYEKVKI